MRTQPPPVQCVAVLLYSVWLSSGRVARGPQVPRFSCVLWLLRPRPSLLHINHCVPQTHATRLFPARVIFQLLSCRHKRQIHHRTAGHPTGPGSQILQGHTSPLEAIGQPFQRELGPDWLPALHSSGDKRLSLGLCHFKKCGHLRQPRGW